MDALKNLGIDLPGLLVYLVNFGIIMIVLTKYLYRPLTTYMDERQSTIKKSIDEAEELKNSFREQMMQKEAEQERAVRTLHTELAQAKSAADEKAKKALAEIDAQRSRMLEETQRQIDTMKKDMLSKAEGDILARMKDVVLHVVKTAVPAEAVEASVKNAWERRKDSGV